jgi:hypothetical protein
VTLSTFVPEIWADFLVAQLERSTTVLNALSMPPQMNDPIIMVCGHPWWLSWWDVTDAKPVRFVYRRDRTE